mgnify:CR=1 FL=1
MNTQSLEQEVELAINRIYGMPGNTRFRCHEIARLLAGELKTASFPSVVVRDGVVQYKADFLLKLFEEGLDLWNDTFEERLVTVAQTSGHTKRIAHSWCEIGDVIVDHQNIIKIPPNTILENLTIVKTREQLAGNADYTPMGGEFTLFGKKFVYIPVYVTRLRI